ncbi:DUF397 domain-containing protein [Streptomyces sp. NPDC041068]|uniref:DUF397 domain-containing protein n=1 Tax=Streptomyces sp. NPDC041068 TaxID=3155130 RepID=UPI0033D85134
MASTAGGARMRIEQWTSASGDGASCVEVRRDEAGAWVRDSKNRNPRIHVSAAPWWTFLHYLQEDPCESVSGSSACCLGRAAQ